MKFQAVQKSVLFNEPSGVTIAMIEKKRSMPGTGLSKDE